MLILQLQGQDKHNFGSFCDAAYICTNICVHVLCASASVSSSSLHVFFTAVASALWTSATQTKTPDEFSISLFEPELRRGRVQACVHLLVVFAFSSSCLHNISDIHVSSADITTARCNRCSTCKHQAHVSDVTVAFRKVKSTAQ